MPLAVRTRGRPGVLEHNKTAGPGADARKRAESGGMQDKRSEAQCHTDSEQLDPEMQAAQTSRPPPRTPQDCERLARFQVRVTVGATYSRDVEVSIESAHSIRRRFRDAEKRVSLSSSSL